MKNSFSVIILIMIISVSGCVQQPPPEERGDVESTTEGEKPEAGGEIEGATFQEFSITQNIYPGYFEPEEITVKKGILVKLHVSSKQYEHINRISIHPFVQSSDVVVPGSPITLEFTPDQLGEFKIRNIGHGFEATLIVVE